MTRCEHCEKRVDTSKSGAFLLCEECGSNLGPADSSVALQF